MVVWELGGELLAPRIDVGQVNKCFGEQYTVDQFALLEQVARVGVSVDVCRGGSYGKHNSAKKHAAKV